MSDTETDEWTPSTEQVRSHYVFNQSNQWDGERGEAFDRWLAAHDAEVRAESAKAHERTKRGAKTLGEIVERQIEDTLRWSGMEDQIGTDDPDQQLAWERCAEMPGRIAALEAELAEVRAGVVTEVPEPSAEGYAEEVLRVASPDTWGWEACVVCGSKDVTDRGMVVMVSEADGVYVSRIAWCDGSQECRDDLRQTGASMLTEDNAAAVDAALRAAGGDR